MSTYLDYSGHALDQMFERDIDPEDVERVVALNDVIEEIPDAQPNPTKLFLGEINGEPLHVVVAQQYPEMKKIVVTTYRPSLELWDNGYRTRRNQR